MGLIDKLFDAIKLNDDDLYDDDVDILDEDDPEFEDEEVPKTRKRFMEKFHRTTDEEETDPYADVEDDDDYVEELPPAKTKISASRSSSGSSAKSGTFTRRTSRQDTDDSSYVKAEKAERERPPRSAKITPMRTSRKAGGSVVNVEVCVIRPKSMENTREIADTLLNNSTVILNLEGIDLELAQRIIDFTSGACYSLGGTLQKVSSYI
ncbi:MAG: cell division protein SepF, partial [Blautia sp.]|nr:cell division protein SepF [Blautia sp.]